MSFKIATWNINSVRLRIAMVGEFLRDHQPDVLCLQETKCPNDQFPTAAFNEFGYEHQAIHGQKGYHGVATISRLPLAEISSTDYCQKGDTRHVECVVSSKGRAVRVHNFYVPAGGDEADVAINPKFAHKMDFLDEMKALSATVDDIPSILVGDLNIAPLETDVWSHKQLLKVVSHTPLETDALKAVMEAGGWADLIRHHIPAEEKLFTWWSYRSKDWSKADKGRRLDHVWSSPQLADNLTNMKVLREARGWVKPSDHVPVIAEFDFN
jgi:exodeoxyribonuclease-3